MLRAMHGFSDAQYGAIFLPQVVAAVIGAVGGGVLAQRIGLKALLVLALLANTLSQALLAASSGMAADTAYAIVLAGTASLGLGFGLSGAPLNSFPPTFFPERRNTAVVALHTLLGLGLMAGPLLAAWTMDRWLRFPLSLLVVCLAVAIVVALTSFPDDRATERSTRKARQNKQGDRQSESDAAPAPQRSTVFWLFMTIAVLYAFAEGTFSSWVAIYLQQTKQLPETTAAAALSAFWGALVAGRLLVSVIVVRVAAERVWQTLPVIMILAFLLLPYVDSPASSIALFALAGLACSAFFPLTMALVSRQFDQHVAWVSAMLTAALMLGVGLGAFAIGALRNWLTLEQLYRVSAVYPILVLLLIAATLRKARGAAS
ncbi:MAG: MFS transporter [Burkholderiales bacterium]|nr:MFS transporter [Burkholderiales bacterium]